MKQLDGEALREFRDSWKLSPRTALKKLERVKAFFRFASENDWIGTNPARLVRGPANIRDTQKLPFEPAEIERIMEACRQVRLQGCTNDDLVAFVLVLRYSGLLIGDASMLTLERFKENDLFLYTQKSGTHVYVPLPPFVMSLVRAIKPRHGQYLFTGPHSLRMETASDLWRRKLGQVFTKAKIQGGHPHRFRQHIRRRTTEEGSAGGGGLHSARPQQRPDYREALCLLGSGAPGDPQVSCGQDLGDVRRD